MGRSLSQTVRSKSNQRQQQVQQKRSNQRIKDEPQSSSPDSLASPSPAGIVQALVGKRKLDDDDVHSQTACTSPPAAAAAAAAAAATAQQSRPKRRATNAHIFRFLQTRNPTKLEESDLKRALEASLEECPDYWPAEDTASCSSSDQSNAPSASSNSSSTGGSGTNIKAYKKPNATNTTNKRGRPRKLGASQSRRTSSSTITMQQNHQFSVCNCQKSNSNNNNSNSNGNPPNSNCPIGYTNHCPMSNVYNRYQPVTKKNIYSDSDFFHEGIMEYIDYELQKRGIIIE